MAEDKKIATGYIGNALRSTAADHITTFADEVFDTERQEYQNEVNDIVGTYIENPEFLSVKTDAEGKLLWWIYKDGSVDWSKGVPVPIQKELKKLEQLIKDNTEGDESVVARVTANEASIAAINDALDNYKAEVVEALSKKMDGEYIENPEFIRVETDAEGKILEGVKLDGTKVFGGNIESPNIMGLLESIAEEKAAVMGTDRIADGAVTYEKLQPEIKDVVEDTTYIDNPEYMSAVIDNENKIISGRTKDGVLIENVGIKTKDFISKETSTLHNVNISGEVAYKNGIPQQVKEYVDSIANNPNIDEIKQVKSLGTPVTLMDYNHVYPNGDIEAKYNYTSVLRKTDSLIYLYYGVTDRNRNILADNFLKVAYCDLSLGDITNPDNWHRAIPNDIQQTPSQKWQEWYNQQVIIPVVFDTDVNTTRISIPEEQRYAGMIIKYNDGDTIIVERYGYKIPPEGGSWDDTITSTDNRTYNDIYKNNDYWIRIENIYENSNYPYFEDVFGDPIMNCYGGGTVKVPDYEYPYRSFQIGKMPIWKGTVPARFGIYMWKSKDGIIFEKCKYVDLAGKTTGPVEEQFDKDGTVEPIIRGNIIKLYIRWRPYPFTKRQIGEEDVDIEGNLICQGHHLFGENNLYVAGASCLDYRRDILFPTYITSGITGEFIKCFIRDNNRIYEVHLPDDFTESGKLLQVYVGNNAIIPIQKKDEEVKFYIVYDAATYAHDLGPYMPDINFNYEENCCYIKLREIKFSI